MKLVTRDADYAIRAVCYIAAQKKKIVPVKELVKCMGIPHSFLRKLLQKLNKEGMLKSHKGKGGGFTLPVAPKSMTVGDLLEVFQGRIRLNEHTFRKKPCPNIKYCKLKKRLDVIEQRTIAELKSITIGSLIK
ncbi:MAG: Rrf2 family transcriptional regulator [Candidatus Omnitrophica bacterium]|nr:Rrf2 family transcriptional regulator [Candidatus Omnitrophota bacterium]